MNEWQIIFYCVLAVSGPLMYLRIVTNDIEWVREYQRLMEERERTAYLQRQEMSEAA